MRRLALLVVLFLPTALAGAQNGDAEGDETTYADGSRVPAAAGCHDASIDIVRVAADSQGGHAKLSLVMSAAEAEPRCGPGRILAPTTVRESWAVHLYDTGGDGVTGWASREGATTYHCYQIVLAGHGGGAACGSSSLGQTLEWSIPLAGNQPITGTPYDLRGQTFHVLGSAGAKVMLPGGVQLRILDDAYAGTTAV